MCRSATLRLPQPPDPRSTPDRLSCKQLINRRRSGGGAIGRAYRHVIERLDVPVVASAGNYGPMPGLVNPWAQAEGVIAAASADAGGTRISPFSSHPAAYGPSDRYHLFSAHGEDTIGAPAQGEAKTEAMLEAERRVDLAAAVGADKVPYYAVRSGTSFAVAQTARLLCRPHQMIQVLGAYGIGRDRSTGARSGSTNQPREGRR